MLLQTAWLHSFLWLSSIPLYIYNEYILCVCVCVCMIYKHQTQLRRDHNQMQNHLPSPTFSQMPWGLTLYLSEAKAARNCQEEDYGSLKFRHKEVVSKRLETEWH